MADDPIMDSLNPFPARDGESYLDVQIRMRAYQIGEATGRPEGREREHWYATEIQVSSNRRAEDIPGTLSLSFDLSEALKAPKTAEGAEPAPDTMDGT